MRKHAYVHKVVGKISQLLRRKQWQNMTKAQMALECSHHRPLKRIILRAAQHMQQVARRLRCKPVHVRNRNPTHCVELRRLEVVPQGRRHTCHRHQLQGADPRPACRVQ